MSPLPMNFQTNEGKFTGYIGLYGEKAIRLNYKLDDIHGEIISIDLWNSPQKNPNLNISVNGFNVTHIINTVIEAIQEDKPNTYQIFTEDIEPKTKGKVSKDISDSINS